MKFTTLILALLLAVSAYAAPTRTEYSGRNSLSTQAVLGSEHAPLIYSGSGTYSGTALGAYTTDWMQIGFSPAVTDTGNKRIVEHNGEYFTLYINLTRSYSGTYRGSNDSLSLKTARFEIADSSNATVGFWNPDSSNLFIADGNYNRTDYGIWTFEDFLQDTSTTSTRRYVYPLKVFAGSHIRFVFGTTGVDDTIGVTWKLKLEN